MKSWTILKAAAVLVIPFAALSGCDRTDPTAPDMSTLNVSANPSTLRLSAGQTGTSTITAVVEDKDGAPISGVRVRFSTTSGSLRSGADGVTTNGNGVASDVLTLRAGDDDATVTARASGAGSDSVTVTAGSNAAPIAVPKVSPTSGHLNDPIRFDGSTSTDSDGSIAAWKWTLSYPGSTNADEDSTASIFTKTYADDRTIHVTLQVTDNEGKMSTVVAFTPDIRIQGNFAPTALISGSATRQVVVNAALSLDGTPSHDNALDTGGSIKAWDWTWGDGLTDRTLTATATHNYATSGPFTASLTVWDNGTATCTTPSNVFGSAPCTNSKPSDTAATVAVTVTP